MYIIQRPMNNFVKVDISVMFSDLTDGAKALYVVMSSLKSGQSFTDTFLMNGLKMSKQSLWRRKKELKDMDLVHVEQIAKKVYFTFVGTKNYPASRVAAEYFSDQKAREEEAGKQ